MMRLCIAMCAMFMICPVAHAQPDRSAPGFSLPPGFVIDQVAGPELANDIYCMTFSPVGDLLASGRGYIKKLLDANRDGVFDQYETIAHRPRDGAMGLLIKDDYLYYTGDQGIHRIRWPAKDKEQSPELLASLKTGGEHDAHAISCGPDGCFYILCGNTTTLKHIPSLSSSSPVKIPVGGFILKFTPDFASTEIICDGFRNAYSFDWNEQGELFTYDSDNERCLGLPWYEGCRFYRIERGGHYGWRNPQQFQFYRLPPYHPRTIAPLLDLGRGSPTGVVCYRHSHFPKEMRNAFFLLDWTFGQIHLVQLQHQKIDLSVFLKVNADQGFAPTSAAVHPITGELYVSSGGRGTRGAIYRIRYSADTAQNTNQTTAVQSKVVPSIIKTSAQQNEWLKLFKQGSAEKKTRHLCLMLDATSNAKQSKANATFKEAYQIASTNEYLKEPLRSQLLNLVRQNYPSNNPGLNRELSRALAILSDHDITTIQRLISQITSTSAPIDDVHLLFVLACCRAQPEPSTRSAVAQALVQLERKYQQAQVARERNWSLRLSEAVQCLLDADPDLGETIANHTDFHRVEQLTYLNDRRILRESVASRFTTLAQSEPDLLWSTELVHLLLQYPSEQTGQLFRKHWSASAHLDTFIPALIRYAEPADHATMLQALRTTSADLALQLVSKLNSWKHLTPKQVETELPVLLDRFNYWQTLSAQLALQLQQRICLLAEIPTSPTLLKFDALESLIRKKLPALPSHSNALIDLAAWKKSRGEIPWSQASVSRGEKLFQQNCSACHAGTTAIGPDLQGVGKRFSRDDLLHAIINPSKDVSPRYQASLFTTHEGKVYTGVVIYEAIDGTMLQTSDLRTIRIPGNQLAERRLTSQSLMPTGLLDRLNNQEVADLLHWLQK